MDLVVTILAAIAALFGIYAGIITYKKWDIDRSTTKFKNTRNAVKANRLHLSELALKLGRENSAHLKIVNGMPLLTKKHGFLQSLSHLKISS
ncbi:MAG: hypothetical protein PHY02_05470 [Phycisphaerae bacterium]|nr:hypothetical protein [Phycisphaerae bacterium]